MAPRRPISSIIADVSLDVLGAAASHTSNMAL